MIYDEKRDHSKDNKERAFELKDVMVPCPKNELTWCPIEDREVPNKFVNSENPKEIIQHACSYTGGTQDITRKLMSYNFDHAVLRATLAYAEKGFLGNKISLHPNL